LEETTEYVLLLVLSHPKRAIAGIVDRSIPAADGAVVA
jgi:hypothetical protein